MDMALSTRTRVRRLAALLVGAAALVAGPAAGAAAGTPGATPTRATPAPEAGAATARAVQSHPIATSVLGRDYRITLTALRSHRGGPNQPPTASVLMTAYTYERGAWRISDDILVGERNSWFWLPLTGRHAVCEFSTASTEPAPIDVSLLLTPSLGCSRTESFTLVDGHFRRG